MVMALWWYGPTFLLFVLCTVALLYLKGIRRPRNFPPGPTWLPVVGNMRELKKLAIELGGQHLALTQLSRVYRTKVLGLKLGGELSIVVSTYSVVRSVLISEEFEGRPNSFFIQLRCMGVRRGITCVDGPLWNEQRNFVVRHLRNIGYGKKPMESMVLAEVGQILALLQTMYTNTESLQFGPVFAPSVLNVLWTLTTGTTLSRNDSRLQHFLQLLHTRSKAFDMAGGTMSQLPWLRHLIPERIGYNMLVRLNADLKEFFMETIQEHHKSWTLDRQDDLIYSFISEMKSNNERESFTDDQLIMICLDLFLAGATTTSSTLDFIFLEMLLHPEIQQKAFECLEAAIPIDQEITYADRIKVPYIEAIIMEIERFHGVAPVIGPRRVLKDTTIEGYNIPQETTVLINIHSVHFDTEYWGDPFVFRPERFIDDNGKLKNGERVLNFGLGRRRCLGELLARQCIFIFFTAVIRKFKVCPIPGTNLPSPVPLPGLTLSPQPHKVLVEPRYVQ